MKNKHWLRLTGWLLILVMVLTVYPIATFADNETTELPSENLLHPVTELAERPAEVDITSNTAFSYTNAKGNSTTPEGMNPNETNQMKLTVSGLGDHDEIIKDTVMAVPLPENITATTELQGFSSDVVDASLDGGKLLLTWKGEKQDSLEATFAVLPHIPTDHDLSGSYVLGTGGNQYYKVMLGTTGFDDSKNKNRKRLSATAFEEVGGKVYIFSEGAADVWELVHVSGDYYTVRSKENGKYLRIDDKNNGLILETATEITAQKLLVQSVGNGYYTFSYNNKSINNSSFNPRNGFASYNYETGLNAILKLYRPSDVITEPIVNLSGTWVITNVAKKNALTAEKHSTNGRLVAVPCTTEGNYLVNVEGITTFTFENIIRDWYTVKTDGGYLNISDKGAFITDNPQHLVVRTDNNYSSIILSNSELYDVGYTLINVNGKTSDGYGTVKPNHTYNDNTRLTLISITNLLEEEPEAVLSFNMNGGTGDTAPEGFAGAPGEKIVLPNLNSSKNGNEFIGWCEVDSVYKQTTGTNHTYHDVYKPGTSYALKAGANTLYAIYNDRGTKVVRFGIRKDGVIQDEPNGYKVEGYVGHFEVDKSILKETHWVIDIDSTKPVNGYYIENNVTANLNWVPSAEQIAEALRNEGDIDFDPETQYIHYYVIKCIPDTTWKIDGVIRNKANIEITYETNAPAGIDKTKISNMPGGYQVAPGTDVLIGADQNSTKVKRPVCNGYYFMGWNTEKDGSGTYYSENATIHLTDKLHLYAQWISEADNPLVIRISSNWTQGKIGYVGARITLTATLTGFEGRMYTLQWQYSEDQENWIDVPDAHDLTYTYTLDETTTNYTWRVVARDVK